jgi:hypothetical protein
MAGIELTNPIKLPSLVEFYRGNGREDPSSLDNRLLKHNEYYWREYKK